MIDKEKIKRINALWKKKQAGELTEEEARERQDLHEEYINSVKRNLRSQLDIVIPVDQEGAVLLNDLKDLEDSTKGNPSYPEGEAGKKMIEEMNEGHREMTDWALDFLSGQSPSKILDVGCGGGAAIANLHKRFPLATIYGIDISDISITETINYNRDAVINGQVRVNQGNVENLPYGSDFFDLVISISSYFFWSDLKQGLEEIKRVLKPGGTLLLVSAIYKGVETEDDQDLLNADYFHNFVSIKEFETLFTELGFSKVEVHTKEGKRWICVQAVK